MIRIGIVGAGAAGCAHAQAFRLVPGAWVTGIYDIDSKTGQTLARACGAAEVHDSLDAMLRSDVEVIDVCTPTTAHADPVEAALAAGKHVIVEAPFARTLDDGQKMVKAAESARGSLFVIHESRFAPEYDVVKEAILQKRAGDVSFVRMIRTVPHPGRWYGRRSLSGGVLLDLGIHDVDWLISIFGRPQCVYARALSAKRARFSPDYALATMHWASGRMAQLEVSWAHVHADAEIWVTGTKGAIHFSRDRSTSLRFSSRDAACRTDESETPSDGTALTAGLRRFLATVRNEPGASVPTPGDALETLDVALNLLESTERGAPVNVGPLTNKGKKP